MEDKLIENPRYAIENAIREPDLPKLLAKAAELHGHFCPFLALGVKAAVRAVSELGVRSTGMEETIAIVETNNCFSDGVQFVTGCSFGNNALIYRDYGKTAFTLAKRSGEAVRVSVRTLADCWQNANLKLNSCSREWSLTAKGQTKTSEG